MNNQVPRISPGQERLSAVDVASLDDRETRGILVLLAGDPNPVVGRAVTNAARRILARTRGGDDQ